MVLVFINSQQHNSLLEVDQVKMELAQSEVMYDIIAGDEIISSSKHQNTFYFNVSFTVQQNKETRNILTNVADVVQSGEMLAIMGPSGKSFNS